MSFSSWRHSIRLRTLYLEICLFYQSWLRSWWSSRGSSDLQGLSICPSLSHGYRISPYCSQYATVRPSTLISVAVLCWLRSRSARFGAIHLPCLWTCSFSSVRSRDEMICWLGHSYLMHRFLNQVRVLPPSNQPWSRSTQSPTYSRSTEHTWCPLLL